MTGVAVSSRSTATNADGLVSGTQPQPSPAAPGVLPSRPAAVPPGVA